MAQAPRAHRSCPGRNGELPLAVPEARAALIDRLRQDVRDLEHHPCRLQAPPGSRPEEENLRHVWRLGAADLDDRLGRAGLAVGGVHEIKPATAGARGRAAAIGFLLRLAARRLAALPDAGKASTILWCAPTHEAAQYGNLYGAGLAALGLDAAQLVLVETKTAADCLWALEESLKSAAAAVVAGVLEDAAPTPARRLALAAASFATPCLLATAARTPPAHATATRWRVAPAASAAHPFDAKAPGAPRLAVSLERVRPAVGGIRTDPFILEWCDETHRFSVAAALADREAAPRRSGGSTQR